MIKYIWEEHIGWIPGAIWYEMNDYYIRRPLKGIGWEFKRRLKIWRWLGFRE